MAQNSRRWAAAIAALAAALAGLAGCSPAAGPGGPAGYAALAARAAVALERGWYNGAGRWYMCLPVRCAAGNGDWGSDSLTYALYLRWRVSGDPAVRPIMGALARTAYSWPAGASSWSDVPMWDAIAGAREYQVTGDPVALANARAAFGHVATDQAASYQAGACPAIAYQQPGGGSGKLKTLETDSNSIKAALLLHQITRDGVYLRLARERYAAVRRYFLTPGVPLYTVYVFDDGRTCAQAPARYFGSVNGNMIWAGLNLARATGDPAYRDQAIATARAVAAHLSDPAGVYADPQAENDVTEPLIEAMYDLASGPGGQGFARAWLLRAAAAGASAVSGMGGYGRFFDGPAPAPAVTVTAWQANGGIALAFAAGALSPDGRPAPPAWAGARFVRDDLRLGAGSGPGEVRFTFTGRAVAIIGTIGEVCCQPGHARVFVDGTETFDQTGIWQNKSSSGLSLPGSVLFAWRWPAAGRHTIEIRPGAANAKEGGSFFHMTGYEVVP